MTKSRFDGTLAGLKAKRQKDRNTSVQPSERTDVDTAQRVDDGTSEQKQGGRGPGKRKSGHVQIAGLVPAETRDDVRVALAFEKFDLSDLLSDLLNGWLETRPEAVKQAIQAKRANVDV